MADIKLFCVVVVFLCMLGVCPRPTAADFPDDFPEDTCDFVEDQLEYCEDYFEDALDLYAANPQMARPSYHCCNALERLDKVSSYSKDYNREVCQCKLQYFQKNYKTQPTAVEALYPNCNLKSPYSISLTAYPGDYCSK
ncbi:hypothetical protein CCACVL1_21188 [Corchorus capsularis]|uniref:Bifunctional inhibitor/plant lipid transfer protein/seed storage helical domain-containing protein n=1 Tax=Corchorus capsularis TaxID=210143 RepID=A0A1R3H7R6_COCAP|nr:hypothetical protein CCACVL1_21188 [Corchorus capsularis]